MKRRKRMLEELEQDIRDHIERETQDNIARGMAPDEAHNAALRKFGNVARVQEETREVWSSVWFEQLLQDVRYGFRLLRRSPALRPGGNLHPRHRHRCEYCDFQLDRRRNTAGFARRESQPVSRPEMDRAQSAGHTRLYDFR